MGLARRPRDALPAIRPLPAALVTPTQPYTPLVVTARAAAPVAVSSLAVASAATTAATAGTNATIAAPAFGSAAHSDAVYDLGTTD